MDIRPSVPWINKRNETTSKRRTVSLDWRAARISSDSFALYCRWTRAVSSCADTLFYLDLFTVFSISSTSMAWSVAAGSMASVSPDKKTHED